ncbi:hypothetical protein T492DRAFT_831913 [Pavlovales sp. CCMP2436]|nr:hypothetical protein T492DRAFT_831913 [Pavlovales sp. CCMP2436]
MVWDAEYRAALVPCARPTSSITRWQAAVNAATLALPPPPKYMEAAGKPQFVLAVANAALTAFHELAMREVRNVALAPKRVEMNGDPFASIFSNFLNRHWGRES